MRRLEFEQWKSLVTCLALEQIGRGAEGPKASANSAPMFIMPARCVAIAIRRQWDTDVTDGMDFFGASFGCFAGWPWRPIHVPTPIRVPSPAALAGILVWLRGTSHGPLPADCSIGSRPACDGVDVEG